MDKALLAEQLQAERDCNYRIWKDYRSLVFGRNAEYYRSWVNFYDKRVRALDYAMEVLRQHDII